MADYARGNQAAQRPQWIDAGVRTLPRSRWLGSLTVRDDQPVSTNFSSEGFPKTIVAICKAFTRRVARSEIALRDFEKGSCSREADNGVGNVRRLQTRDLRFGKPERERGERVVEMRFP